MQPKTEWEKPPPCVCVTMQLFYLAFLKGKNVPWKAGLSAIHIKERFIYISAFAVHLRTSLRWGWVRLVAWQNFAQCL